MYNHIIVGLGITGCSAAYHLVKAGATNLLLLDYGVPGVGSTTHEIVSKNENANEKSYYPFCSGTAVYKAVPQTNKIITVLPNFTYDQYAISSLGKDGLKKYIDMATFGRAAQQQINLETNSKCDYRKLGCMMVCFKNELDSMKEEYQKYKDCNVNCQLLSKEELKEYHGAETKFEAGILFPDDGVLNSTTFCQYLLVYLKKQGCKVITNSSPMKTAYTDDGIAKVVLHDGTIYKANSVILATGAFYLDINLAGLLTPMYSYYQKLPCKANIKNSPSYFTFGFSYDWTLQDNHIRVSGEDNHSGFLPPQTKQRWENLQKFIEENYFSFIDYDKKGQEHWSQDYGRYSATVDKLPICGNVSDQSKIYYMVGCNACGQTILSAVSALAPGLLGYRKFTEQEQMFQNFVDIRRFEVKFNDKYFIPNL